MVKFEIYWCINGSTRPGSVQSINRASDVRKGDQFLFMVLAFLEAEMIPCRVASS